MAKSIVETTVEVYRTTESNFIVEKTVKVFSGYDRNFRVQRTNKLRVKTMKGKMKKILFNVFSEIFSKDVGKSTKEKKKQI